VINELNCTVTAFGYDPARGLLAPRQSISTLPADFDGDNSTAEVQVHPTGRFVYGSNRGHDSIVAYSVDPDSGQLTLLQHVSTQGKTPRNFGIDPSGTLLLAANQDSDSIVAFRIDTDSGVLRPTGHTISIPSPVCVKVVAVP
jgi:6-phosphogluconolactonase